MRSLTPSHTCLQQFSGCSVWSIKERNTKRRARWEQLLVGPRRLEAEQLSGSVVLVHKKAERTLLGIISI